MADVDGPPLPAPLILLTGPVLFAALFSWTLYGLLIAQYWYYLMHFENDRFSLKAFVSSLFILETFRTALIGYDTYCGLARGWGDRAELLNPQYVWLAGPFMDGIVGGAVQFFYGRRIYILSGSRVLYITISLLSFASFAMGVGSGLQAKVLILTDNETLQTDFPALTYPVITSWLSCTALCDVVISVCMVVWYLRIRPRVLFKDTSNILARVIRITVVSGSLTAGAAISSIFLYIFSQNTFLYECPGLVLGTLFANSFFALLNQRRKIGDGTATRYLYETDNYDGSLRIRVPGRTVSDAVSTFAVASNPHALPPSRSVAIDVEMHAHTNDYADTDELEMHSSAKDNASSESVRGPTTFSFAV